MQVVVGSVEELVIHSSRTVVIVLHYIQLWDAHFNYLLYQGSKESTVLAVSNVVISVVMQTLIRDQMEPEILDVIMVVDLELDDGGA